MVRPLLTSVGMEFDMSKITNLVLVRVVVVVAVIFFLSRSRRVCIWIGSSLLLACSIRLSSFVAGLIVGFNFLGSYRIDRDC